MVNQTIEIWSLDLAGIKEIMVFQCIAKLVESLASPATSFATKQAEMFWQWRRYRSASEEEAGDSLRAAENEY